MSFYHSVKIGDYLCRGNLFLAPVAGYSDSAYRSVCTDCGCSLAYTEMVSSEALVRKNLKTENLLFKEPNESEYAIQLFGANPETMANAALMVAKKYNPVLIDVNCGCPVPKIIKSGAGSALMTDLPRLKAIVSEMTNILLLNNINIPITVKMRLGWSSSSINYLDAAKIAVDAGAKAITLHARTREQGYSGTADVSAFFKLANSVAVPVFASGDIFSPDDALRILSGEAVKYSIEKKPAAVMFARGAMGDPFIFSRTKSKLCNDEDFDVSLQDKLNVARKHFFLSLHNYKEHAACVEFRKQICSYLKGLKNSAELKRKAIACSTVNEYESFFEEWQNLIN